MKSRLTMYKCMSKINVDIFIKDVMAAIVDILNGGHGVTINWLYKHHVAHSHVV